MGKEDEVYITREDHVTYIIKCRFVGIRPLEEAIRNLMRNEFQKEYFRTVSEGK